MENVQYDMVIRLYDIRECAEDRNDLVQSQQLFGNMTVGTTATADVE